MNYRKPHRLFFLLLLLIPFVGFGQSYVETFGQNRIQNRKFQWKYFDTKHFRVYHYDKAGRQLGRYVAEEAENEIKVVEKKLGGQFPPRFSIVLYNSYDEYRQSNIGLNQETQLNENSRAGSLNLVGDKLVVYFTGLHTDLKHQIRYGMAKVVMQRMLFGENFKKMVKNAVTLNLPQWVTDGYLALLVDGWDAKTNSGWKSLLDARPDAGFYALSEQYPELAGKAFWKFIEEEHGAVFMKNMLYAMQTRSSINKVMKDPEYLGMKISKTYDSCIHYYQKVYKMDAKRQERPDSTKGLMTLKVPKDNSIIRNIQVSPRGSDIAYVAWKDGEYTIYSQKTSYDKQLSTILQGGQKDLTEEIDPNYPIITWSNTGNKMAILYKKNNQTRLRIFNSQKGRIEDYIIPPNRFDRVMGMTFNEEEDKLIFSAIRKSQTDLYMFTTKGSKLVNITDDVWDDVSPVFVSGGAKKGILFLSNRPKPNMDVPIGVNELPTGPMNLFFYNTTTMSTELLQCTHVKTGNVSQPVQYGADNFAYLYDANGIQNKYVIMFGKDKHNHDSLYSVPITNYNTSIISQQYNVASGDVADVVQEKDKYVIYFHPLMIPGQNATAKTLTPTILSVEQPEKKYNTNVHYRNGRDRDRVITDDAEMPEIKSGNTFQTEFVDTTSTVRKKKARKKDDIYSPDNENNATDSSMLSVINDSAYLKMKPSPYKLSFKPGNFTIRLDNSVLFTQYQPYTGGAYINPSLSALTTMTLDELMENHRFTFGFQLPINQQPPTYFIQYQNFTRRLDWGLSFIRTQTPENIPVYYVDPSGQIVNYELQLFQQNTNIIQSDFSWPLDRVRSIKFNSALRQDNLVQKAQDSLSLNYQLPNPVQYWSMSRVEYVFDNTVSPATNIRFGTRFKVYSEYLYQLTEGNLNCYNIGLDFRNYTKLYKNIIWASRVAYAHSDGNDEVQYQLGGVDNWIQPQSAPNLGSTGNYGFSAMETSLRGYDQNARQGNNFAIFSNEIRFPVLTTLLRRPIQSPILKNLQFVAFMDMGDAWRGFTPDAGSTSASYSYPNLSSQSSGYNNVFLQFTVPNTYGLALGYGAGLRTSLLGYFLRFDLAYNIDNPSKPVAYFALGTDF